MAQPSQDGPVSAATFRGTLSGDGRPGPIEERLGRRLIRLIDPESDEGLNLLAEGKVDLLGPDGTRLGTIRAAEALKRLRIRLEERLAHRGAGPHGGELADGLDRLDVWKHRLLD
jgi:hypothetical protein